MDHLEGLIARMTTGTLVESPVRGNSHAGFGGRPAETERPKGRHRAAGRPYLAQRAVDQVRRDEWNAHERSHTPKGRWIKGTRWSLLKSPDKQTIGQLALLGEVQHANRKLYRAFLLKEELRVLYHLDDPALAPAHLDAWLAWTSRSRLQPFIKLARTIRRHRDGILAAIRLGLSNGLLEGLNSRIRLISHRSFGFHSATPLIALIYLCCSGIVIDLPR
jgi:transposase